MNLKDYYVYDIETFKYAFTFSIVRGDGVHAKTFEVSKFQNELEEIYKCLSYLEDNQFQMVGFNSLNFDYPIIHSVVKDRRKLLKLSGAEVAKHVWGLAQKQIESFKGGEFGNTIKQNDILIPQIDLYKVMHYDNRAKSTSLKMLEFNMCMENIEDLPYGIEEELTEEMIQKLKDYNAHDVEATRKFFIINEPQIDFRIATSEKYGKNMMNHNDGKIGNEFFSMKLEEAGIPLYTFNGKSRKPRQSKRSVIALRDCIFNYYDFKRPECIALMNWFKNQKISETKGVFSDIEEHELGEVAQYAELTEKRKKFKGKPTAADIARFKIERPLGWIQEEELKATETVIQEDGTKIKVPKKSYWMHWRVAETLNIVVDGLRVDFGTGGIHASRTEVVVRENKKYTLVDKDVASQYPNLGISNRVYPEHLSETFCDIYEEVYKQRKMYAKGTPENLMLKFALNIAYGNSNNQYSPLYDPKYTMQITINGQLSILLLAEKLLEIEDLRLIQLNTDGLTAAVPRASMEEYQKICSDWEKQVKLELEESVYSAMYIRDVNSYCAVFTNGKVKYKGAYVFNRKELEWHKNHSALVIPMAACASMMQGVDVEEFIRNHAKTDAHKFDFCLRAKVPRSSSLVLRYEDGTEEPQQNICRYYPSLKGGKLVKRMPALEGKEEDGDRELSIEAAYTVKTCNNMKDFSWDDLNFDYYVAEAKKLIIT